MNTAKKLMMMMRGSGAPAFSPLDISGLVLWLDASDSTTLFQDSAGTTPAVADAAPVGYATNKAGGNPGIQATAGSKPTLKLAIKNGKNVLRFDGNDVLSSASLTLTTFTMFLVCSLSAGTIMAEHGPGGANDGHFINPTTGNTINVRRGGTDSGYNYTAGWARDSTWRVLTHRFAGTHATNQLYINGQLITLTAATGTTISTGSVTDSFHFGARSGPTLGVTGDMPEVLIYTPSLTLAQQEVVVTYLNTKWSVF